jgi:hypothetical protein
MCCISVYSRLKVNNSDEVLVVPIGIEVSPQPGLYPEEDIIDLGVGGSLDPNTKVKLYLKNSNKKAIKILVSPETIPFSLS